MECVIDQFGRVIIPKKMRDHLGLKAGSHIKLEEQNHTILLKPAEEEPLLKNKHGVMVFTGKNTADIDEHLKAHRQTRIKHIGGQ